MMTSDEAIAARKTLGLSQDGLAASLGLTTNVIEAWEAGTLRIPKSFEDELRYNTALAERQAALETSGLQECEVDNAWLNETPPDGLKAHTAYLERGLKHRSACPICLARDQYIEERFGEMPPVPMSGSMRVFGAVVERMDRLPRWAQPAAWGAIGFGLFSIVRIVFLLPGLARHPEQWTVALGGLALSVSIGAAIGLVYSAFRELRDRFRARKTTKSRLHISSDKESL